MSEHTEHTGCGHSDRIIEVGTDIVDAVAEAIDIDYWEHDHEAGHLRIAAIALPRALQFLFDLAAHLTEPDCVRCAYHTMVEAMEVTFGVGEVKLALPNVQPIDMHSEDRPALVDETSLE